MTETPAPTPPPPANEDAGPRPGAGRGIALAAFSVMLVIGALVLIGGLAVIGAHTFVREDGFYNSGEKELATGSTALLTEDIDLSDRAADWAPDDVLGDLRFQVEAADGEPVFLGIARTEELDTYLDDVAHAEVTHFGDDPRYAEQPGANRATPPAEETFWAAQAEGSGLQTVEWEAENGNWTAVAMNPDGAAGVDVTAEAGVEIGWLIWLGVGLALVGAAMAAGAIALIASTRRRA